MLLIISKTALVLFLVSFAIMVFHPKIKLPKHIDFLLMLSIIFGVALFVKDDYSPSPAGTLFYTTVSNLSSMKYFSFLASFGKLAYLDLSNKPL